MTNTAKKMRPVVHNEARDAAVETALKAHEPQANALGLRVLLGELQALSKILPCADQNTADVDGAEDAFDNMPI